MRGIRIVAFAAAVISGYLLFSHVVGIDPWPQRDDGVDLNQAGPPPQVPPPPPLPGSRPDPPPAAIPEPARVEETEPVAGWSAPALENASEAVEEPVVFTGDVQVLSPAPPSPTAFTAHKGVQTASVPEPSAAVPR